MKKNVAAFVSLILLVQLVFIPVARALELDTAITDEYEIQDGKVIPKIGAVFSDLNVWGNTLLRVFTNSTKTKQLSAGDKLSDGNVIELEEDGAFAYITVCSNISELIFAPNNASEFGSIARGEASDVYGALGKDTSDSCVYMYSTKAQSGESKFSCYKDVVVGAASDGVWSYLGTEGYLIIEASIATKNGTAFKMFTNSNYGFFGGSGAVTLNANVWNKVYIVYDFDTKKSKKIVNAQESAWTDSYFGKNKTDTEVFNALRLYFEGDANNTGAYIDDLSIYISKNLPKYNSIPTLDENIYNISNDVIISDGTLKVSDITLSGAKIKAFSDNEYTEQLDSDAVLENGNAVLVEKDGLFKLYYVNISNGDTNDIWHMDETALANSSNPNRSKVTNALGGKENGTVYYFETNKNSSNANAESYIRFNASAYGANGSFESADKCLIYPKTNGYNADTSKTMQSYEGYMIISLNLYPTSTGSKFRLTRRAGGIVAGSITTSEANHFMINRWNKVIIFVRLSANSANRTASTYVNGQFVYTNNSHSLFSLSSGQDEDLRFGTTNDNGAAGFYIDDMYVSFTTEMLSGSELEQIAANPSISVISNKVTVSGNTLTMLDDVTVSELDNANTDKVTAFEDSTLTATLSQDSVLDNGNIVVVTDNQGKMSYYSVSK